jgi:hypothetical protein
VLDDYTALRNFKMETLAQESTLFPVSDAMMYVRSSAAVGSQGASYYAAANPAYGATIAYFYKEAIKTKKMKRQEAEREAERKKQPIPYPSRKELLEEAEEEPPALLFTISDAEGKVVRRLTAPVVPGVQRIVWDFRYASPVMQQPPPLPQGLDPQDLAALGFNFGPQGALVMPGKYSVTVAKKVGGVISPLPGSQSFNVIAEGTENMLAADRAALAEFQGKITRLQRAVTGALDAASTAKTQLTLMKRAAQEAPGSSQNLLNEVNVIDDKADEILQALRGGRELTDIPPPSINQRVSTIAQRIRLSALRPSQSQLENYRIASEELSAVMIKLKALMETDLAKLEKSLDAAGAPWTPGRMPEWSDK